MKKTVAKRLVRYFYFIALLLNVVIPWMFAKITVGDKTGEIQMVYILVAVWSIGSLLVYAIYFTIPEYTRQWEKIAAFLFPSILTSPMIIIEFPYFIIPWGINFFFNIICILVYKKELKKVTLAA